MRTPSLRGADTPVRAARQRPVVRSSGIRIKPVERASVVFEKSEATPIFERSNLPPNHVMRGTGIINEYSATTVIPQEEVLGGFL